MLPYWPDPVLQSWKGSSGICRDEEFVLPPPQRGYAEIEPYDEAEEEQQRIALGQGPSDGGGNASYGSPEADKAAARLQQLGVTVSPPGRTGAIDWQSLAGGISRTFQCRAPHV